MNFIFHNIYGMSSFPLTNTIIFQDGHIAPPTRDGLIPVCLIGASTFGELPIVRCKKSALLVSDIHCKPFQLAGLYRPKQLGHFLGRWRPNKGVWPFFGSPESEDQSWVRQSKYIQTIKGMRQNNDTLWLFGTERTGKWPIYR